MSNFRSQANLTIQEAKLNVAQNDLNVAQGQLDEKQAELDKVQAMYDKAVQEKQVKPVWDRVSFSWIQMLVVRMFGIACFDQKMKDELFEKVGTNILKCINNS